MSGEVLSHDKGLRMRLQRREVGIVDCLDHGFFDRLVHAFDLAIDPGVADLSSTIVSSAAVSLALHGLPGPIERPAWWLVIAI
ncbi:TPA: hypothetical protein NIF73_003119 [Pseudomonas aeruginosa]|nr:hypothetical protein [Pseudomonas aeruginosa]